MHRVLIVDDNDDLRESMATLLRSHRYEVFEARNGEQGLKVLRSRKNVDLILLDLMMPVMNGATFRWRQRWDPSIANIPVLVLTSVMDGNKSAEVLGADGYLRKPFDADALIAAVTRIRAYAPRTGKRDNTIRSREHSRDRGAAELESADGLNLAAHPHAGRAAETPAVFPSSRTRDASAGIEWHKP